MKSGIKRAKIRKGDMVQIIAGKDYNHFVKKGDKVERTPHRGRVLEVSPRLGKVKVEGAGVIKKHQRANPQSNRGGGIIDKEAWIDISNVQLIDPQSGDPTRIRYEVDGDGEKSRVAARSGMAIQK